MQTDSEETRRLLGQVQTGDLQALGRLLTRHQAYLQRFVELRLDPRLRARLDPADVVQEARMEAVRRLPRYLEQPRLPFRLWLRELAHDRLLNVRRDHAKAARRSVEREVPLPDESAAEFARQLLASGSSPKQNRKILLTRDDSLETEIDLFSRPNCISVSNLFCGPA